MTFYNFESIVRLPVFQVAFFVNTVILLIKVKQIRLVG